VIQRRLKRRLVSFHGWRWLPPGSRIWRAKKSLVAQSGSWTSHHVMMATLIDLIRSTFHNLEYKPGPEPPTQKLQGHLWWVLTRMNCLMSRQHWSPIVTCHTGLSRGSFRTDGRTDDRTMAAGASVTWTHCSVLFEVTWDKTAASARTHQRPRGRAASRPWMPRDYIRGPQTFHSHFLRRLGLEKLRCVWCTSWSGL
jgi:hypothetical protein